MAAVKSLRNLFQCINRDPRCTFYLFTKIKVSIINSNDYFSFNGPFSKKYRLIIKCVPFFIDRRHEMSNAS